MHINKLLNIIITVCSLLGDIYSNENYIENRITIEVTQNLNLYIYYNNHRELIENFEDELSNNNLYNITKGFINASNVYRKNDNIVFENFCTNDKCNIVFSSNSKKKQGFILNCSKNKMDASTIEINSIKSLNINSSTDNNIKIDTIKGDGIGKVFLNGKEIEYNIDYK